MSNELHVSRNAVVCVVILCILHSITESSDCAYATLTLLLVRRVPLSLNMCTTALVTIHATSECGSGPTHWKGWTKGGTSSIIAGCGGGKGGDNGEGKINVAYSYNLSPTCADWAKVAYPEALGVVAAWDLFSVERWAGAKARVMSSATGYSDSRTTWGCKSAEGESTANQKEAYELMTAALRSYIKPSCNIGYETVGVATC